MPFNITISLVISSVIRLPLPSTRFDVFLLLYWAPLATDIRLPILQFQSPATTTCPSTVNLATSLPISSTISFAFLHLDDDSGTMYAPPTNHFSTPTSILTHNKSSNL